MRGFLFGKLPAFGDFVSRGLTGPMRGWWDDWCVAALREERLTQEPHGFLQPPPFAGALWQLACAGLSRDRVGRAFPFVIGLSLALPPDDGAQVWLQGHLAACLRMAGEGPVDLETLVRAVENPVGAIDRMATHVWR